MPQTHTMIFDDNGIGILTITKTGTDELDDIVEFEEAAEVKSVDAIVPSASILAATKYPGGYGGPSQPLGDVAIGAGETSYELDGATHRFSGTGCAHFATTEGASGTKSVTIVANRWRAG